MTLLFPLPWIPWLSLTILSQRFYTRRGKRLARMEEKRMRREKHRGCQGGITTKNSAKTIKDICVFMFSNNYITLPIPTLKSSSREVRQGLTEETVLQVSLKRCVGVGQLRRAWRGEACLPPAKPPPSKPLKMTVDPASVYRPWFL